MGGNYHKRRASCAAFKLKLEVIMANTTHADSPAAANPFGITVEAWNAAAVSRKFRVENGTPWIEKDGALAPVLPPTSLDEIFHAVAEYRRNRIGGSLNGVSLVDALAKAANGNGLPSPKSNDAFDAIYTDRIAELTDAARGWTDDVVSKMSAEQKAERAKQIASNAASPNNQKKYYQAAIEAAIAAGKTAGAARVSKRKPGKTVAAIDL